MQTHCHPRFLDHGALCAPVRRTWAPLATAFIVAALLAVVLVPQVQAHGSASAASQKAAPERHIVFPDVEGRQTLVVDLHSHSVFSDGHVWPKLRIEEALRDGLDGFAVTEHLEYQPHLADIPHPDRNRAFEESLAAAKGTDLIVIAGSEITRDLPSGHINAVFITDANALLQLSPTTEGQQAPAWAPGAVGALYANAAQWPAAEAVAAANAQNAFVFINHPDWPIQRPNGIASLTPLQRSLIKSNQLHGIEIANGQGFSTEALAIGLKHDLVLLGTSDVHDLIDWDYPPAEGAHRPVTLVFAIERSAASMQQALREGRTVVWFKNLLVGREEVLQPLLDASLTVTSAQWRPDTEIVDVTLANTSDARFELRSLMRETFGEAAGRLVVPAHGELQFSVKPGRKVKQLELRFEVENALTAPGRYPQVRFALPLAG